MSFFSYIPHPPKTDSPCHLTSPTHTHTQTYRNTHTQIHRYIYRETHRYTHTHGLNTGQVVVIQFCLTLCYPVVCTQNSAGKNARVGCHFLLQGIFLAHGSNPHLSCVSCIGRQILYSWATWLSSFSLK